MKVLGNLLLVEEAVIAAAHDLSPEHFLNLSDGDFPGFVLVDGETLENFDRFFGCALRLQIGLQDVNIILGLFETVALDGLDALEQLATIEDRLGAGEWIGGLHRRFAFDKGESVGADAESLKIGTRDAQINFIAPAMDVTDLVNHLRIRWVDLIPDLGLRGRGSFAFSHDSFSVDGTTHPSVRNVRWSARQKIRGVASVPNRGSIRLLQGRTTWI
jgi:hypothetical protein